MRPAILAAALALSACAPHAWRPPPTYAFEYPSGHAPALPPLPPYASYGALAVPPWVLTGAPPPAALAVVIVP